MLINEVLVFLTGLMNGGIQKISLLIKIMMEFHRKEYPNTALIIVSGIDLERGEEPSASGGRLDYAQPWQVPEDRLRPTAYEVRLPLGGD